MDEGVAGEFEAFYPDPLNLWLSIQCRPFEDGVVLFFRDITDRRQADLVLQQQQELLASIQNTSLVATWDIEYATGKVTYGAGSYPVFGHPLSDVPDYRAFKKIVLPEYIPIIAATIQSGIKHGQLVAQEFQVRAADGRILWLESRGHAVMDNGVPTHLRGLTIDITARKKNEEALVASEARYRVLADLNPQAIWMGAPTAASPTPISSSSTTSASPSKTSAERDGSAPSIRATGNASSKPGTTPSPPAQTTISKPA